MSVQFELPSGKVVASHTFGPKTTLENVHMWIRSKIQDKYLYQVCLFDDHDFSKPLLSCSKELPKEVKTISIVKKFHPHVQRLKGELDQDPTCLVGYAVNQEVDAVDILLQLNANPNTQTSYGLIPLHCTSARGNMEATRLLLQAKADPTCKDGMKCTPRRWASMYGYKEIITLLDQAIQAWKE
jgi:hypothetical protein